METTTEVGDSVFHTATRPWFWVWLATFAALTTLVTLLSIEAESSQYPPKHATKS